MPRYACVVCARVSDARRCPEHRLRERPRGRPWQRVRQQVLARDGHQCTHYDDDGSRCDETSRLHVDHVLPIAVGGTDDMWNLVVLCQQHDLQKGAS